jgi:hypothetical protein
MPESGIADHAPYAVGNILWEREAFVVLPDFNSNRVDYRADGEEYMF